MNTVGSRGHRAARSLIATAAALLAAGFVAGCSNSAGGSSQQSGAGKTARKVALLLPETKTSRYEARDRPTFEKALKSDCNTCELLYYNAGQDVSKQLSQAETALTNGANVLVLDPVDSKAAAAIATKAKNAHVPVISYDRLVLGADIDYVVKFDNVEQGRVQAQALVDKLKADGKSSGTIVMVNGSPSDANAQPLKTGAHSVIDSSGLKVGLEYDTPDWSPDKAQQQMEQALTRLGAGRIDGVYVANDGMAAGVIAALKGAGVNPLPPVTGLDADLAAVQRVVAGEQYETTYLNVEEEAQKAAKLAALVALGQTPPSDFVTGKLNNGLKDVPGVLLKPTAVTLANLKPVIIDSGYLKAADVCTGANAQACQRAGIS